MARSPSNGLPKATITSSTSEPDSASSDDMASCMANLGAPSREAKATLIPPPAISTNQTMTGDRGAGRDQALPPSRAERHDLLKQERVQRGITGVVRAGVQSTLRQALQSQHLHGDGPALCLGRPLVGDHVPRIGDDVLPHVRRPRSAQSGQQLEHVFHQRRFVAGDGFRSVVALERQHGDKGEENGVGGSHDREHRGCDGVVLRPHLVRDQPAGRSFNDHGADHGTSRQPQAGLPEW